MKCNEAEKQILLQDSGEIAHQHIGALVAHLHDCEACRRFRHALMEAQENFQRLDEPSPAVLKQIQAEAHRCVPKSARIRGVVFKPLLALAASIVIVFGVFLAFDRSDAVGMELTEIELLDTHDQLVNIMYSGLSDDDLAFNFLMTYEGESEG